MATRAIIADLSRDFEDQSADRVAIEPMGGVDAARLVRNGAKTDVVILAGPVMRELETEGLIVTGSIAPFARSGMAIAVPAGCPWPDIGSEAALARAISSARKIGYSTGPSGRHLLKLCDKWGFRPLIDDRMVEAPPGVPVGTLLANGEVDLGFQQLSELHNVPGIEVVGPLPEAVQVLTVFSAGVCSGTQNVDATRRLIAFFASPVADETKRNHGMEPA